MEATTVLAGLNTAAQVAGSVGSMLSGGNQGLSREDQRFMADKSWKMADRQQDWLENQIYNRSKDAVRAGIHPLAAIGVMPSSGGSPVSVPGGMEGPGIGERLEKMGQNVSRAIQAQQNLPARALLEQQLSNEKAQGDFIRAQTAESLARAKNLSLPPAMPSGDRFGFSHSGDVMGVGPRNVLIRNPDGSINMEDSPQYGSTLYHRPISTMGRDLMQILADAYKSLGYLRHNLFRSRSRISGDERTYRTGR